jgi:hypothetical protein
MLTSYPPTTWRLSRKEVFITKIMGFQRGDETERRAGKEKLKEERSVPLSLRFAR